MKIVICLESPSTLAKSNINNYNTIPRKPIIIKPNNLDSDISGSVNEGSGSVITSIGKVASGIHLKPEVSSKTEKVIKQVSSLHLPRININLRVFTLNLYIYSIRLSY